MICAISSYGATVFFFNSQKTMEDSDYRPTSDEEEDEVSDV